jgi:hypothetical protein
MTMSAEAAQKDMEEDLRDDVQEDDGDLEIEVVDDVDEDSKPRVKDYDGPEVPEDDELESYSERVQKRMKKLSFEAKEAERQRQALAREREELLRVTQTFQSENERLRQQVQQSQGSMVAQAKARLEAQISQAKADYKDAYEVGDADKIIEAQEKLTRLSNELYRVSSYRPPQQSQSQTQNQSQPAPQAQYQPQTQQAKLDDMQSEWLSENGWFGEDRQMTAFALGVHEDLVYKGVDPNSKKYYDAINVEMRKRFPDKFEEPTEEVELAPKKKVNVVTPASRSSKNPRKIKLTSTQISLAKRLGLTPEQYAAQLLKDQKNG